MGKFHFPDAEEIFIGNLMIFISAFCVLMIALILQLDVLLLIAIGIFCFVLLVFVLFMFGFGIKLIKDSIYW
jgi:hypothetical protein